MAIAIVHEKDTGVVVSRLWNGARRAAVVEERPVAIAPTAEDPSPEPRSEIVEVTPAETEEEFAARMVGALVPQGSRHIVVLDDTALPDVAPDRWIVDWNLGIVTIGSPPPPTIADVVAERERRLALGFNYDFGNGRGVHHIGTTPADMIGWDEVTKSTHAMIALGQPSATLTIVTNTGPATITALEWQQILLAATSFRQPIWMKSFALQAMTPIPADYTADIYWV